MENNFVVLFDTSDKSWKIADLRKLVTARCRQNQLFTDENWRKPKCGYSFTSFLENHNCGSQIRLYCIARMRVYLLSHFPFALFNVDSIALVRVCEFFDLFRMFVRNGTDPAEPVSYVCTQVYFSCLENKIPCPEIDAGKQQYCIITAENFWVSNLFWIMHRYRELRNHLLHKVPFLNTRIFHALVEKSDLELAISV